MKWKNIDYIRAMDTDELTNFLYEHLNCKPEGKCPVDDCNGANCKEHIKKWLQEARK